MWKAAPCVRELLASLRIHSQGAGLVGQAIGERGVDMDRRQAGAGWDLPRHICISPPQPDHKSFQVIIISAQFPLKSCTSPSFGQFLPGTVLGRDSENRISQQNTVDKVMSSTVEGTGKKYTLFSLIQLGHHLSVTMTTCDLSQLIKDLSPTSLRLLQTKV